MSEQTPEGDVLPVRAVGRAVGEQHDERLVDALRRGGAQRLA